MRRHLIDPERSMREEKLTVHRGQDISTVRKISLGIADGICE